MNILPLFIRRLTIEIKKDEILRRAAAIAYYTVFSLPAFGLVVISIAGWALGKDRAKEEVLSQFGLYIGNKTIDVLRTAIDTLSNYELSEEIGWLGGAILIVVAINMVHELRKSLNLVLLSGEPKNSSSDSVSRVWGYFFSSVLLLISGALLVLSIFAEMILHFFHLKLVNVLPVTLHSLTVINHIVTISGLILLLCMLYSILPERRYSHKITFLCSVITASLFLSGTAMLSLILSALNIAESYGVAASALILLIWIYYSAIAFLIGAELIDVSQSFLDRRKLQFKSPF